MIRRYVYDLELGAVVEAGMVRPGAPDPDERYLETRKNYEARNNTDPGERNATTLRHATLERADRREFAHKKYGDERRWAE